MAQPTPKKIGNPDGFGMIRGCRLILPKMVKAGLYWIFGDRGYYHEKNRTFCEQRNIKTIINLKGAIPFPNS